VSENGPREGTRDLPRRSPEAGQRAPDEGSSAGTAYRRLSKSLRRRRAELVALASSGDSPSTIAKSYESVHPLEPVVTKEEIELAVRAAERSQDVAEAQPPSRSSTRAHR
jgi:hypothetical protein